ncbi:hypothetical protein Y032_0025g1156 [Ancylostoma ceylanicum]|nr:hypothetical protein Y032_0025g1156 [Ancylostoma ceylanicum]
MKTHLVRFGNPFGKGLVIAMTVECILGAAECMYEAVNAFHVETPTNFLLNWIRDNFAVFLFVVFSMNSYGIIFMSNDLRKEVIRFCWKMFKIFHYCGIKIPKKQLAATITTSSRCLDLKSTSRIQNNRVCVSYL